MLLSLLSLVIKQLLTPSLHSVCLIRPEVWRYGLGSHNVAAAQRRRLLLAGSHAVILIQTEEEEGGGEEELNCCLLFLLVKLTAFSPGSPPAFQAKSSLGDTGACTWRTRKSPAHVVKDLLKALQLWLGSDGRQRKSHTV